MNIGGDSPDRRDPDHVVHDDSPPLGFRTTWAYRSTMLASVLIMILVVIVTRSKVTHTSVGVEGFVRFMAFAIHIAVASSFLCLSGIFCGIVGLLCEQHPIRNIFSILLSLLLFCVRMIAR